MTYTPGPWAVRNHQIISTVTRPDWADEDDQDERICVVELLGAMGGEDSEADAQLIAAAPDLYAACDMILAADGDIDLINFQQIRDALDKAEGLNQ